MFKRKNIWFYCPACDEKLVVGVEASGYRATCPECNADIPIPLGSNAYPNWVRKAVLYGAQGFLLAGVVVAGWLISTSKDPELPVSPEAVVAGDAVPAAPSPVEQPSPAAEVPDVNQQLLSEHAELEGRYNKMLQWIFENYRGKYPIPERLVNRLRIEPVDEKGAINADLVEVLKLTDEEKLLVQDVITYVRTSLKQKERELATIKEQVDDKITYTVPVFAETGAALREDLYRSIEKSIGAPRFDRMLDVAGESMREQMHYFGEASRELTFEVIKPQFEGQHPPYLLIRDGWVVPEGSSVRVTRTTETAVMKLPDAYQDYRDWLPDHLQHYAMP